MKYLLIFIFILFANPLMYAQANYCGVIANEKTLREIFRKSSKFNQNLLTIRNADISRVRKITDIRRLNDISLDFETEASTRAVAIHAVVLRGANGRGGISEQNIERSINNLNNKYRKLNISFYVCHYTYINNDTHFNHRFSNSKHPDYITRNNLDDNNVDGAINIYFVPNSSGTSWSSFPWMDREHIVMYNNHVTNGESSDLGILSHEIGHWFGLLHTFESARGKELVARTNCTTAGDGVCDTPADPDGSHNRRTCTYTDDLKDANGDLYKPMVTNIMSYYFDCLDDFTKGQEEIIQTNLITTRKPVLSRPQNCSMVGQKVKGYKWSEGWTNTEFFTINNQAYLFLLKQKGLSPSGKNVHIHKVNRNGTVGQKVKDYQWSGGWTNTEFFTVNNQTYLFLLKQKGLTGSDKNVHIHKVNSDGTIGKKIQGSKWSEGWTSTEFFTVNNQTYLCILKQKGLSGSGKNVHIYKMNSDGTIGKRIKDYKWSEGWTNMEFFTVNNQTYLYLLKQKGLSRSGKNVHIHKVNGDGTVGQKVKDYKWSGGWTSTEFLTVNNKTYLYLLKEKGLSPSGKNVHIHELNSNGTVGKRVEAYNWSEGWTNVEFFTTNNQTYLYLLKQKGLSRSNENVHIHLMK